MNWPEVTLDRVTRLRILSHALPGVAHVERIIDAPFDTVWGFVSDLERSVPIFDTDVAAIEIISRDGDHLKLRSRAPNLPISVPMDVELRDGWCWMAARPQVYVVGMAAEPLGERTRFAMLEGVAVSFPRALRPIVAPITALSAWRHRHHLQRDMDGIERALGLR